MRPYKAECKPWRIWHNHSLHVFAAYLLGEKKIKSEISASSLLYTCKSSHEIFLNFVSIAYRRDPKSSPAQLTRSEILASHPLTCFSFLCSFAPTEMVLNNIFLYLTPSAHDSPATPAELTSRLSLRRLFLASTATICRYSGAKPCFKSACFPNLEGGIDAEDISWKRCWSPSANPCIIGQGVYNKRHEQNVKALLTDCIASERRQISRARLHLQHARPITRDGEDGSALSGPSMLMGSTARHSPYVLQARHLVTIN